MLEDGGQDLSGSGLIRIGRICAHQQRLDGIASTLSFGQLDAVHQTHSSVFAQSQAHDEPSGYQIDLMLGPASSQRGVQNQR